MSKYGSKKVIVDGIKFDSKDESLYYQKLKEMKRKGEIISFTLQPKVILIPKFNKLDKKYLATTYSPDFLVTHLDGSREYIDVKGFSTQQGDLRRKLFNHLYREEKLTWISRSLKYGIDGWIEYDQLQKIRKDNKKVAN